MEEIWQVGRRKTSIARVKLTEGKGNLKVNKKVLKNYFKGYPGHEKAALSPLKLIKTEDKYDILINVSGGGIASQAQAIRHGIARALSKIDETIRITMRKEGFLTRDSRMVERKKFGQKKARKKFQWTKR